MPYCPRCGVEVEDRLELCPLCDTAIPAEVRDKEPPPGDYPQEVIPPRPLYRELTRKQRNVLVTALIAFIGIFPIIITLGIDFMRSGTVTWSFYVLVPVIGVALISWFLFRFGKRPIISVNAVLLIALVIQLILEKRSGELEILTSIELQFYIAVFTAVELFLLFVTFRRPKILSLLIFILMDGTLLLGGFDYILSGGLDWSLIAASSILPVAGALLYLQRTPRKGLNLPGFFFLDLTVMLLALNLSVSGTLSWSLVTALIFIPMGLLFYGLHILLFNDTDWRKALHL